MIDNATYAAQLLAGAPPIKDRQTKPTVRIEAQSPQSFDNWRDEFEQNVAPTLDRPQTLRPNLGYSDLKARYRR